MSKRLIAACAVSLGLLAGCGGNSTPSSAPVEPPAAVSLTEAPAAVPSPAAGVTPASVNIPKIGAQSTLIPLGLAPDGSMEVPSVHQPKQASWFEPGPEPGQDGPAVIAGHIDGDHIPGVFKRLSELREGDQAEVTLTDGRTLHFTIYKVITVKKDAFPSDEVFGYVGTPEIRFITCGGDYDSKARSYKGNIIAFGKIA